jgi:hypothetical protein
LNRLNNQLGVPEAEREIPDSKDLCTLIIETLIMQATIAKQSEPPTSKQLFMLVLKGIHAVPKTKAAASWIIEAIMKKERDAARLHQVHSL